MHYTFKVENELVGFCAENVTVQPNETKKILIQSRGVLTSDDALFHKYIEQLYSEYFKGLIIGPDTVSSFLVIVHTDLSADLYINQFNIAINVTVKRDVKAGEYLMESDIANITKLSFPGIIINENDKVVFCSKIGWRFGLFFDLTPRSEEEGRRHQVEHEKLNVEDVYITLGSLYRYLSFYHIYKILESETQFTEMINDGWFPFIEILTDYRELDEIYKSKYNFESRIESFVEKFDSIRIKKISDKWWNNPVFEEKKSLLEAGLSAYLQDSNAGNINAIKNLITEVEGLLRKVYLLDTNKTGRVNSKDLIDHIINRATVKSGSEFSLLLPAPFLRYLKEIVFANFDSQEDVALSRNSSSHGVAHHEKYTKARALQLILILDQIYFCK